MCHQMYHPMANQQDPLAENASNSPNICQQQNYLNNSRNKNSV